MNNETFIGMAVKEMMESSVDIQIIRRHRSSKNSANCFDATKKNKPKFIINYYDPTFETQFPIFVHEFCHFKQWKEQTPIWSQGFDSWKIFDRFLNKKVEDFPEIHLRHIQMLEIDCDTRVIDFIQKFNLNIDTEKYIKDSNAYVYSYNVIVKERYFPPFAEYHDKEFIDLVPSELWTEENIKNTVLPEFDDKYSEIIRNLKTR